MLGKYNEHKAGVGYTRPTGNNNLLLYKRFKVYLIYLPY